MSSAPGEDAAAAERLLGHIRVLSSDEFAGRKPGTEGETKTLEYLTGAFRKLGLAPGNSDGTFLQAVPLIGITSRTTASFETGGAVLKPAWIADYIAMSRRTAPRIDVTKSELVFAGYGVVAPEYGWDDYKDADVRGKTVVVLINDPPVPDPEDPSRLDPAMFTGKAMTYYGRWTYKFEQASAQGAAACMIVHETGPAGYPFQVVVVNWAGENFDLETPDGNAGRVAVEGWFSLEGAKKLFAAAGKDFDRLKADALRRDFRPVPLGAKANFSVANTVRSVVSHNAAARLPGADPAVAGETVLYVAHWDHLGRDLKRQGDPVYHGAADNASGTALMLEIARSFSLLPAAEKPRRGVLFLGVTAEEMGLLGSRYYAEHPLYPLRGTLAAINLDGNLPPAGLTRDVECIGFGKSTLEEAAAEILAREGRVLIPDTEAEKGYFYRSDHFPFAKQGVPGFYGRSGVDVVGRPPGYGAARRAEFTANDYHNVTDQVKPWWDLLGTAADAGLLFELGRRVADGNRWPEWKPGCEFKARREAAMAQPWP